MLIQQTGKCEKCSSKFGRFATAQSTNVECEKCKKKVIVCTPCKNEGCECGGKLLDGFERLPGYMF